HKRQKGPFRAPCLSDGALYLRRSLLTLRGCPALREERGGIAAQDLLALVRADLRLCDRLVRPVDAEGSAVGAAHDAIGAVKAHSGLDGARPERVAVHEHPGPPEARRPPLFLRRV